MFESLAQFFDYTGFMPYGYCIGWTPSLLWTYVLSDSTIGIAYYSISAALTYFAQRRKDFPLNWIVVMFAVFIFACGTTHFMAVFNIWHPYYWVDAGLKTVTAVASIATAILIWPLIPKALALPSAAQMEQANRELQGEILVRRQVEREVKKLNELLEERVRNRTRELETANRQLENQIVERRRAEQELQTANFNLKKTVGKLAQRTDEISRLRQMGEMLQSCVTAEEANQVISRFTRRLVSEYAGALFIYDTATKVFEAKSTCGGMQQPQHVISADECWALRRGKAHLIDATETNTACEHLPEPLPRVSICLPLTAHGEVLGMLHLHGDGNGGDKFGNQTELTTQLAGAIADQAAVALANIKLRDTLRIQAIQDPLTGLYNRRFMEEVLRRETLRAERAGQPLGILMLDLDHFKQFNDSLGHDAGDAILQEVGRMLKSQVRGGDIACRYGGEEFVVVLQESEVDASFQRAEQLRAGIMAMTLPFAVPPSYRVTVSIGVAGFPADGASWQAVLAAADQALYTAKQEGRNRTVMAG